MKVIISFLHDSSFGRPEGSATGFRTRSIDFGDKQIKSDS